MVAESCWATLTRWDDLKRTRNQGSTDRSVRIGPRFSKSWWSWTGPFLLVRPVPLSWSELIQDFWKWYRFELVPIRRPSDCFQKYLVLIPFFAFPVLVRVGPVFLKFSRSWSEPILSFLYLSGPESGSVRGSLVGISSAKKKVVAKKDPFKKTTVSTTLASFNYNKGLTIQEYVRINELFRQSHTKCKLNVDSTWLV